MSKLLEKDSKAQLIKMIKACLSSSSKQRSLDGYGNVFYVDCNIYSNNQLSLFLDLSLSEFNQIPYFTSFTWDDPEFITTFANILVEGAVLLCLASQSLIERGREFQFVDGYQAISFTPPTISEMLETQYSVLIGHHFEKLKLIKSDKSILKFGKGD